MTPTEIIQDLKSRGERSISFRDDGVIVSLHGKSTVNYWVVINGELKCIDCKTVDIYIS